MTSEGCLMSWQDYQGEVQVVSRDLAEIKPLIISSNKECKRQET